MDSHSDTSSLLDSETSKLYKVTKSRDNFTNNPDKVYPKPNSARLEDFKSQLDEWSKLEDQIRKLNIAKRERMVKLRVIGNSIQNFMTEFGYENINRRDGSRINFKVKQVKEPITLNSIKNRLAEIDLSNFNSREELLDYLFKKDDSTTIEKRSLRRIVPKVSSHLDL